MSKLYSILGIGQQATPGEIKSAFRQLARDKHPDADPDNPRAEDAFKDISRAYAILSDPKQRASYDRGEIDEHGTARRHSAHSSAAGQARQHRANPFDEFFRRRQRADSTQARSVRVDGSDVSYSLRIDFMEAAHGATKHVSMTTGKRLKVTIPAGTRHEQVLRLKGQGMGGVGGGKDGDALVEILVDDHDQFRIEGDNILLDLPVTLREAVLGGPIQAPTVDGPVNVTVPPNANTGTTLRLRGKGAKKSSGNGRGDQLVRLQVMLPTKPDAALGDFVRDWKPAAGYNPRKIPTGAK